MKSNFYEQRFLSMTKKYIKNLWMKITTADSKWKKKSSEIPRKINDVARYSNINWMNLLLGGI
jgi:hypothetical protein